ncbi:MAG: MBL fold metallo-hydrolase [Candidatus Wallbacteria bacterium]|nr:MBL fold metallo-hydrolase [Candidatus Wallbacteria bacterium]
MTRLVKTFTLGDISTNCYLLQIGDGNELIAVDPALADPILEFCSENDWKLLHILFTHGHYDHLTGAGELVEKTGASLVAGVHEQKWFTDPELNFSSFLSKPIVLDIDRFLEDGEEFAGLRVIHTPGHTPGGLSFAGSGFVISGDTLFAESIGRTDLPGGDYKALIRSIQKKLFTLPDLTLVYPGHGPQTKILHEKQHNPFLVGIKGDR